MKSKRKIALSLAILYVVSVIGVALSLHFCGGKLASVKFYSNVKSCKLCKDIPDEKKDDDCCKNTHFTAKVKDSHNTQAQAELPKLFSIQLFIIQPTIDFVQNLSSVFVKRISNKAPPISGRLSLHVLNCAFRI
jgi:hypothetical protein